MYYQNLIKVLCGLIQAALLRAIEFMAYTETEQFIEGTRIMKKEAFRKVLAVPGGDGGKGGGGVFAAAYCRHTRAAG